MCFEHNLCAKLTSSDTLHTTRDNEQQEQLHSTKPTTQSTVKTDSTAPKRSERHIQEKLRKPTAGDYHHFIYESIVPATTQSLKADDAGRRPSIKRSPTLSKIEEEDSASNTSACSEEAGPTVPLKPPVKFTSLQDFSQHIIKSPLLAAIEEESIRGSVSSTPDSTSCSPTAVNRGIMQSLMDQKIEHASRDDGGNAVAVEIDDNSDLGSVSLDPAIWSDSDNEQITNTEESPQPSKQHGELVEKDITPAMKAIGSVCVCVCVCVCVRACACVCDEFKLSF